MAPANYQLTTATAFRKKRESGASLRRLESVCLGQGLAYKNCELNIGRHNGFQEPYRGPSKFLG